MYKKANFRFVLHHENSTSLSMKVLFYGVRPKRQQFKALQSNSLKSSMLSSQSCTQSRLCFLVTLDVSSRAIFAVRVLQSPLMSRSCRRCSHRLRGSSWKARRASGIFVTSQIQARSKYKGLSSRWVPLSRTG